MIVITGIMSGGCSEKTNCSRKRFSGHMSEKITHQHMIIPEIISVSGQINYYWTYGSSGNMYLFMRGGGFVLK